jgi:hypothetical protein
MDADSRFVALMILFEALTVVDSIPGIPQFTEGVWYPWIFVMTSLTGLVVGPSAGFLATAVVVSSATSCTSGGSPSTGLEADVLFRVILFVPLQTYRTIYGLPFDVLQLIWAAGALVTPVQVALSVVATTVLGTSLTRRLDARVATFTGR